MRLFVVPFLRSGDVDGKEVYSNGTHIVDICLIAEQIEIRIGSARGVLSIMWKPAELFHSTNTSVPIGVDVAVCFADQSQTSG